MATGQRNYHEKFIADGWKEERTDRRKEWKIANLSPSVISRSTPRVSVKKLTLGRTRKRIPPPWYKGWREEWLLPFPSVNFCGVTILWKYFTSNDSLWCALQDLVNIESGHHLGFTKHSNLLEKWGNCKYCFARVAKYDTTKQSAAVVAFILFHRKKV